MAIPLAQGCCNAICRSHPIGQQLFDTWYQAAMDGVSFIGPWSNDGTMDDDPRVLGHRHDMPSLGVAAHRLSIPFAPQGMFAYAAGRDTARIVARGM